MPLPQFGVVVVDEEEYPSSPQLLPNMPQTSFANEQVSRPNVVDQSDPSKHKLTLRFPMFLAYDEVIEFEPGTDISTILKNRFGKSFDINKFIVKIGWQDHCENWALPQNGDSVTLRFEVFEFVTLKRITDEHVRLEAFGGVINFFNIFEEDCESSDVTNGELCVFTDGRITRVDTFYSEDYEGNEVRIYNSGQDEICFLEE